MKYCNWFLGCVSVVLIASASAFAQVGLNRIEGRVIQHDTNIGVNNAYVELYSNTGTTAGRTKTTGQGRFHFRGMGPGRYTIVVKPYGMNLREESVDVEINNQTGRSDTVFAEVRLHSDRRKVAADIGVVGTVFAQEVPADAKRLYRSGIDSIQSAPEKAFKDLEEAVKILPTYFDALAALGKAYVVKGKYETGYPYLLRAIDVNSRCSDCYYSLSLAFYKLNQLPAAIMAINAATTLQPKEPTIRLLQGMIHRLNNDLKGAENSLLMAKSLFKVPNSEVHWQLSHVYNRLNRNREAADELEQYLKIKTELNDAEKENVRNLISRLRNAK